MPQYGHSGEPGCLTTAEAHQVFRHNWDPTSYWQCGQQGVPALKKRCATNKLFSVEAQQCVDWKKWQWTEPQEPPSRPQS